MKNLVSVAPMMDCTDRHDRFFLRLISKSVMLYSEMIATKSAIHGDRKKILAYSPEEKPLALQVGGSDKKELSEVAKIAEDMGYDEININLGCPSKKVQKNMFGACLMKEPNLVSECINEMINSCSIPVTAKTRIGFDDTEDFDYLNKFIIKMKEAGCKTFILHARKAILKGLTPKQNLSIPKLNYEMVYKIKTLSGFTLLGATLSLNKLAAGMARARAIGQIANVNVISMPKSAAINICNGKKPIRIFTGNMSWKAHAPSAGNSAPAHVPITIPIPAKMNSCIK